MPKIAEVTWTDAQVKTTDEAGFYNVGGATGLYLQITPSGGKSFSYRFVSPITKRRRDLGLGPYPLLKLSEAREKAREARRLVVLERKDPIEVRKNGLSEAAREHAKAMTFEQMALEFYQAHQGSWATDTYRKNWLSTMRRYIFPRIGRERIQTINVAMILKTIQPHWARMTTAPLLLSRVASVFDFAKAGEYLDSTFANPAAWKGLLQYRLPDPKSLRRVVHMKSVPYEEMPAFMAKLRKCTDSRARALEFLIYTAVRPGECIGAQWSEIDLASAAWTIPSERLKKRHEFHRVPLCQSASAILKASPHREGLVFPGPKGGRMSDDGLMAVMEILDYPQTVHGFRSAMRTYLEDTQDTPHNVCEVILGHYGKGGRTARAYARGSLWLKRVDAHASWERWLKG